MHLFAFSYQPILNLLSATCQKLDKHNHFIIKVISVNKSDMQRIWGHRQQHHYNEHVVQAAL